MKKIKALLTTIGIMAFALLPAIGVARVAVAATDITNQLCAGSSLNTNCDNNAVANSGSELTSTITNVINILSWVVGIICVVMIIIGGFKYVTSGGNDSSITSAKNTILYAIVGLVIVALAQIIVHFVIGNIIDSTSTSE